MKVAFWGNQGNVAYRLCKWLRERGVEVHLYMMKYANERSYPEKIDPKIKGSYPEWITCYNNRGLRGIGSLASLSKLMMDKNLLQEVNSNDTIVSSGSLIYQSFLFKKPFIFLSLGGDLATQPFFKINSLNPLAIIDSYLISSLTKKSLRKCKKILTGQLNNLENLKKLKLEEKGEFFLFPEDCKANKSRIDKVLLQNLTERYRDNKLVFFMPSRLVMDKNDAAYKGSEKFLLATEMFFKKHPGVKVRVIVQDYKYSIAYAGKDSKKFRELVEKKKLESYYEYIPHLPYYKLLTYMSVPNFITFDQFNNVGIWGGIGRECLSVGGILVSSYDANQIERGYGPGCPVFSATTPTEILSIMEHLIELDEDGIMYLRQKFENWALKYLHWENKIDEFIEILEGVKKEYTRGNNG